jgi:hypothetical protein
MIKVKQMQNEVSIKLDLDELGFMRYAMKKVIQDLDERIVSDVHEILFHSFEQEEPKPARRGRPPAKKTARRTRK